jgi:ABC-type multidrug transport system fused ATPase/permease subunit
LRWQIRFERVGLRNQDRDILQDVTVTAAPGEPGAIAGESGATKRRADRGGGDP